jgi:pimeloyl-ACP methyl ester carboxylesterase
MANLFALKKIAQSARDCRSHLCAWGYARRRLLARGEGAACSRRAGAAGADMLSPHVHGHRFATGVSWRRRTSLTRTRTRSMGIEPRSRDVFLNAPGGRLFARVWGDWQPPQVRPPIVLIHDSLGSVELWRDFPSSLAAATRHPVVAYDRLGFGRSDPHPSVLETIGFIRDEARTGLPALRAGLAIDRMILFGHSVGGAMALVAAVELSAATVGVITESAQVFAEGSHADGHPRREVDFRCSAPDRTACAVSRGQGRLGRQRLDRDLARACLCELDARRRSPLRALPHTRDAWGPRPVRFARASRTHSGARAHTGGHRHPRRLRPCAAP